MRLEDLNPALQNQVRHQLGLEPNPLLNQDPPGPATQSQDERALQRLCEQELTFRGIIYLHLSFRAREKVGWPDLTFALQGIPYVVELKTASGSLTKDQTHILADLKANGWRTHVIRSYEAFTTLLSERKPDA